MTQMLARIERMNYLFGAALIVGAALGTSSRHALGIAVGVALSCLNFAAIRRLVSNWVQPGAAHGAGRSGFLFLPKTVGLMVAVALALFLLPISGVGLAIGYSVFVMSIFVEATRYLIVQITGAPRHDTTGEN